MDEQLAKVVFHVVISAAIFFLPKQTSLVPACPLPLPEFADGFLCARTSAS